MPELPDVAKMAGVRYFEKIDPRQNERKFWSLQFVASAKRTGGVALKLAWGRIGTSGDDKVIEFDTDDACLRNAILRAGKKVAEGYRETRESVRASDLVAKPGAPVSVPMEKAGLAISKTLAALRNSIVDEMAQAEDRAFVDGDGWRVENGRSVRPRAKTDPDSMYRNIRPRFAPDPPRKVERRPERPPVVATLAPTGRTIDFED